MDIHKLKAIIRKYNSGKASPEEIALVEEWYDSINGSGPEPESEEQRQQLKLEIHEALEKHISEKKNPVRYRPLYRSLGWAAVIAGILILTLYLYKKNSSVQIAKVKNDLRKKNDIPPGGNKAVLILADGSRIVLDSAKNGVLAQQGRANIMKTSDGKLVYRAAGNSASQETRINSLVTPPGGKYQIMLPDGTRVWLNATSSLKFPSSFTGKERTVELSGEAYFEVAKNKHKPFRVKTGGMNVEVLGTHFNIMAYQDEKFIETTLLEGSVKINKDRNTVLLTPGQQARTTGGSDEIKVGTADTEAVIAWKNGLFYFNEASLDVIMRQISRWYDVEVVYTGEIPDEHFRGKISRDENLSQVLKILELSGINFTIEGRKIIIKS